jgi:dGTPase
MREQWEVIELGLLAKEAALSRDGKRVVDEKPCPIRTSYQHDRDRVIHSKAFRRLKGKTQVFLAPKGDHYRTRLTHTLEVSQISRTIARALRLNEDLTEAIALAHDLGHTPFGHSGEFVLNSINGIGFRHHLQSVRVVENLEKNGAGLNLTLQVKNGIAAHSRKGAVPETVEAQIVRVCDKIAYINHDIEDAVCAGILTEHDLPRDCTDILGKNKSARITSMVTSIIENYKGEIKMSDDIQKAHDDLEVFLEENIYFDSSAKAEESKAKSLVETLFNYYKNHPDKMPADFINIMETEGVERAVTDYISGMTDHYAMDLYENLFVPKVWAI